MGAVSHVHDSLIGRAYPSNVKPFIDHLRSI